MNNIDLLISTAIDSLQFGFTVAIVLVGSIVGLTAIYSKIHGITIYQSSRIFRVNFILAHRKMRTKNICKTYPICKKCVDAFFSHYLRRYLLARREAAK